MVDRCEHCDGNGWVWQEYSVTSGGDYQKCHHCMKAPMPAEPTTWISRPVCATEAMIEAGATAIRLRYLYMSADRAWSLAKAVLDAGALASPSPPPLDVLVDAAPWVSCQACEGRGRTRHKHAGSGFGLPDEVRECPTCQGEGGAMAVEVELPATGDADHG